MKGLGPNHLFLQCRGHRIHCLGKLSWWILSVCRPQGAHRQRKYISIFYGPHLLAYRQKPCHKTSVTYMQSNFIEKVLSDADRSGLDMGTVGKMSTPMFFFCMSSSIVWFQVNRMKGTFAWSGVLTIITLVFLQQLPQCVGSLVCRNVAGREYKIRAQTRTDLVHLKLRKEGP